MQGFYFIVLMGALSFFNDKQVHDIRLITEIKISVFATLFIQCVKRIASVANKNS